MMVIPSPRTLRAAVLAACCIILPGANVTAALAATPGVGGQGVGGQAIGGQAVGGQNTPHVAATQAARQAARQRTKNAPASPPAAVAPPRQLPARAPFTVADEASAAIPGMPDARFWADSTADFVNALPAQPGPWLALSSGGSDGAFGAGVISGLTAGGARPDYAVVTGVSSGALMAPFVFAGSRYDDGLRTAYTKIAASDIFEVGSTGESFVDSWPLKDLIAKQITPALLADIAAEHRRGRRLFVTTTDLDAERSVVWNMGAIAAHGGDDALKLFRTVLLASSAIPGGFPPVLIDVEANGKRFAEMHVDGGVGGQFFVAPAALMASTSDYRLPATQLTVVVNTSLEPEFSVVERSTPMILTQTVGTAVKVDTRLMLDRAYLVAKRSGVGFNVASIPPGFSAPSRGAFDPEYMRVLFQAGFDLGKSATPFRNEPPPYPARLTPPTQGTEKTGENR
jgi:predicted acylesterase/phospholipase RssA